MARQDLQAIKEQVRARADIVEIIGGYTRLKQAGKEFRGLCPFHADKTPSLSVSPAYQWYNCWSCGEKGDVFTFIEKKEHLTFIESLEMLAQRFGIPFERGHYSPEQTNEREEMFALNSLAANYYRDKLKQSDASIEYLARRGILKETQDRFDIGSAPPDWDGLATYLQRRRANMGLAMRIGLVRERKETSGYTDYYRNRIMFPIHDLRGNVAGFGGRALGDEQPKYLNSPQSEVFSKSSLLYGLYFARQRLSADRPPVFVEGYTDVVTTHQAGFTQCVATLGTAMTEEHAQRLVKYSRKAILCYDGDQAGANATLKGAAIWEGMGVEGATLLVARLPDGDDPDSLLKRGDIAAFQNALDNAISRVDFEIELILKRHNESTETGRDQALSELIPVLATVRGASRVDRYVQRYARLHSMYNFNPTRAMESILADITRYRSQTGDLTSSRSRRHVTVETQNGAPLREQALPPSFPINRSSGFNPNTRNWIQPANRPWGDPRANYAKSGKFGPPPPAADLRPPPIDVPHLLAAEKAEYTLLRGLLSGQWRNYLLGKINVSDFVSEDTRELANYILQTRADEDGNISPVEVIREIERSGEEFEDPFAAVNGPDNLLGMAQQETISISHSAKMTSNLRHVVEDSELVLSNEPLTEATLDGCVRRLQERRSNLALREVRDMLEREDLTEQQRRIYLQQHKELMRANRGSASGG